MFNNFKNIHTIGKNAKVLVFLILVDFRVALLQPKFIRKNPATETRPIKIKKFHSPMI